MSTTELSLADRALHLSLPLAAAPVDGALPALDVGKRRLIVAADGVYVEAASHAMRVRVPIGACDTPYGNIEWGLKLPYGKVPMHLLDELVTIAQLAGAIETAALILANPDVAGYEIVRPRILSCSGGEVTYDESHVDRARLVVDMHSHGRWEAGFSQVDDQSDQSRMGPHVSLVIGKCLDATPEACARLVIPPYLIPIELEDVFE